MSMLSRQITDAYWPPERGNSSADANKGNAAVDALTLGKLQEFFLECRTGPTYCMVARHVNDVLKNFPPHIVAKREAAVFAMDMAKRAFAELAAAVEASKD